MKKIIHLGWIVFLFSAQLLSAQSARLITGKIVDEGKSPMEFVNVMLLKSSDTSLVKGTITDREGKFELENIPDGNYNISLSQLGFDKKLIQDIEIMVPNTTKNIGTTIMNKNITLLEGVDVVAKKPFIEHHTDKTVVNVENSIVDAGSTALEVLQKSPGVTVDNSDNISLKGKNGVNIMLDGKPSHLSNADVAALLKNMPSDQVQKIEIMTNPPAKFDASGNAGVINIVLKKDKKMGANGGLHGSFGQGKRPDASLGLNFNFRQNKTNVFGSYDYDWRKSIEDLYIKRNFRINDQLSSVFLQNSNIEYIGNTHNYKGGIDYYLDAKNTFGVLLNGMNSSNVNEGSNVTDILAANGVEKSDAVTFNNSNGKWSDYSANLNWQHKFDTTGTQLSIDLDYAYFDRHNIQNFNSKATDYITNEVLKEQLKNDNPSDVAIKSVKADFEHPFSENTKMEAGIKSSYVVSDNNVMYYNYLDQLEVPDTTKTNHFIYSENINAAYVSFNTKIKDFGIQAGLRGEQTVATGEQVTSDTSFNRNYIKLFPTFYLERSLNKNHQLNFSFSRRYDRPSYQDLNPFRYFLDQYTYQQGNSLLEPQYSYNFELAHTFKGAYSTTINYSVTDNVITQITHQIDSTFTTYLTKENINKLENYGIAFSIPISFTKWWTSNNYINYYVNHYTGYFDGGNLDEKSGSFNIYSSQSFSLPSKFSIELSGWYQSEQYYGIIKVQPMWSISTGIEKKLFDDRASIKILINDIFYKSSFKGSTHYLNQDVEISSADDTRFVRIHFNYRFGKKTVAQARRHQTGAEEERNRIKKD